MKIVFVAVLGLSLMVGNALLSLAHDSTSDAMTLPPLVEVIRNAIDTVLSKHTCPPTRQEMVAKIILHCSSDPQRDNQGDLAQRISDTTSEQQLYQLLSEQLILLDINVTQVDSANLQRVSSGFAYAVPGGFQFVEKTNAVAETQLAANRYVGIGVQLMNDDDKGFHFTKVFEGGAAANGGVLQDDILESVESVPCKGRSIQDVIQQLRGPAETSVNITVRTLPGEARNITLVRNVIPIKTMSVSHDVGEATWIAVERISASSQHELQKILEGRVDPGKSVVLDLRSATVASLHHLHLFADALLDKTTIGDVYERSGKRTLESSEGNILGGAKLAVMHRYGQSDAIDWIMDALDEAGIAIFYEQEFSPAEMRPRQLYEYFPIGDGEWYAQFATTQLGQFDPAGQKRIGPFGIQMLRQTPFEQLQKKVEKRLKAVRISP